MLTYDNSHSEGDTGIRGPETADGTLVIIVCRGKHLPNRRKLDKQSPYCTLRIGTLAKKTDAKFRAGQTPEWTQEIRFDLTRDKKPVLRLDVLDETKHDPTPIGATEIDCSQVFSNPENQQGGKYIFDKWYNLSLNGRRAGMIYLEMTFYPTSPVLPPKIANVNEPEIPSSSMRRSFNESIAKNLPLPPPQHPARKRTPNVSDEVFVSSEDSKSSKRLSLFKYSHGSMESAPPVSGSIEPDDDKTLNAANGKQVDEEGSPSKGGKFASKFSKLKQKFQAKDPITTLWNRDTDSNVVEMTGGSPKRSASPISVYGIDHDDQNEYGREDNSPPPPPPRSSVNSRSSGHRKSPPKDYYAFDDRDSPLKTNSSVAPFSADTIGMESSEEPIPSQVFLMNEPVTGLKHPLRNLDDNGAYRLNPQEIDPKFYAPTPTEHLNRTLRLQNNQATKKDLALDLHSHKSGYLGDGKFSPTVFDKLNHNDENRKPHVPPKIPRGLTAAEYYIMEKEKYLNDLKGQRF